ncbi:ornithine cyclodeaminase family protein [Demetria terragena]|uniref:ornithine cyclodeaminase family protein n=1 Tax=Demetria terragena TaxID=63959 RepID=UPI000380303D|nr:ornithine cyclodeaminase family protein [Demetria terragena]
MAQLPFLTRDDIAALATDADAVDFLHHALEDGRVDPEQDSARLFSPAPGGEFLFMPTGGQEWSGVKLITIAPGNPANGKPKIQGHYTLIRSADLEPVAMLDGIELTLMRTPAVTVLAVRQLLAAGPQRSEGPLPVVIFGTGPQAARHLSMLADVVGPVDAVVVGRRDGSAEAFVESFSADGVQTRAGTAEDVRHAAVVICVTSSATPVLDGALISDNTIVAAVGSHGADKAELPADLVRRADVAVEARASAMRESGDLLQARPAQEWEDHTIGTLADLVNGSFTRHAGKPAVFSGVGMAWEDLVIATDLWNRSQG